MKKNSENSSGRGERSLKIKLKKAKGKTVSQVRWLERQLNDPYVKRAKLEGYRGRAAFKIKELDDKFNFFIAGSRVIDLGCAPGGWCQVAVKRTNALSEKKNEAVGRVLGVDYKDMDPVAGAEIHKLDFLEPNAEKKIIEWFGSSVDVVMSDMAAPSSGHKKTDHLRVIALCESAAEFAFDVLDNGGTFIAKVLAGGAEGQLQKLLKFRFAKVVNFKPPSSRADSSEKFVVAKGFRQE